jgi:hypothetical protein
MRAGSVSKLAHRALRLAAGVAILFVVWFNFVAGFAYVAAGIGLWRHRPWTRGLRWRSRC